MRNVVLALRATVVLAVLTGLVYPLAMTGIAQVVFPGLADGSPLAMDGRTVGSELIGQAWEGPQWFYGRPSAIDGPYDASTSYGSNLGPRSRVLADDIRQRARSILRLEAPYSPGITVADIPVDLLTASASGLDPHISPAAAAFEAPRVAAERRLPLSQVVALIHAHTEGRTLGVLGEPRVNVLELNLALAGR